MTNKKETLIETLRGSLQGLETLPQLISEETIYDETGHVDCNFLTAILEWMSRAADLSVDVQKSLNRLLGVDDSDSPKRKAGTGGEGVSWNVEDILKHCSLVDNVMRLPRVQFNKKSYAEAKKRIEEAGGSWMGGKTQGFVFPFDARRVFAILQEKGRCDLAKDYQFFETPDDVADWLVTMAGGIDETDSVLEPSAGRGALVNAIRRACPDMVVDCCELLPENREWLSKLSYVRLMKQDFTEMAVTDKYTKIIANPPFSRNQDIRHVRKMYELLAPGGTLASITSQHWSFGQEQECIQFRAWLHEVGGVTYQIEPEAFKESGTSIGTMAVVIEKLK